MRDGSSGRKRDFWISLFRTSILLQMLDRLSAKIYHSFGSGFFGWLFTGYPEKGRSFLRERISSGRIGRGLVHVRRWLNQQMESSILLLLIQTLMKRFLRCRIRVFGMFFVSFGTYTAASSLISGLIGGESLTVWDRPALVFAIAMITIAIPLVLSKDTLAEILCNTYAGAFILRACGFTPEQVQVAGRGAPVGRLNIGFLFGIVCGSASYMIAPWWILCGLAGLIGAYLLLCKPEIGVMALFFCMPFLPTMALAALVIYVFLCFILKLLRGKRIVHPEPLDIMVAAFGVVLCFGGLVSLSTASLRPALLFVCFLAGYFETVWLLREREWVARCAMAGLSAAVLVSLYGIFQYLTGSGNMAEAWVDAKMFSAIGGRAVSTLENPNMLGEYLILMIPLSIGMLLGWREGFRRIPAFLCLCVTGCCLLLTWSRGAWLGLMIAAVLFVFIWDRRAVWLLFAGVASIPILPYVLPASIINRFTSIGNLSDSSTSYRVYIWRATSHMLSDFGFSGIGIGEGAWRQVYPMYAYLGIEAAPHSHNLFLQIWLETGIWGLLVFVAVLFLFLQSVFTFFRSVRQAREVEILPPSRGEESRGKENFSAVRYNRDIVRTKRQLRLSCAAPFCGIVAVLMQGLTDYSWYNYRVYLMFWLMLALTSAYVRTGRNILQNDTVSYPDEASTDILYRNAAKRRESQKQQPIRRTEVDKNSGAS